MNEINPRAIAVIWALTVLMAGAISIGPLAVYIISGLVAVYTIYALVP